MPYSSLVPIKPRSIVNPATQGKRTSCLRAVLDPWVGAAHSTTGRQTYAHARIRCAALRRSPISTKASKIYSSFPASSVGKGDEDPCAPGPTKRQLRGCALRARQPPLVSWRTRLTLPRFRRGFAMPDGKCTRRAHRLLRWRTEVGGTNHCEFAMRREPRGLRYQSGPAQS